MSSTHRMRKWRNDNPDKARESARKLAQRFREKNPERHREFSLNWYRNNREKARTSLQLNHVKRTFKVGSEEAKRLITKRQKGCEVCGSQFGLNGIDHNHNTGQIRGVLCQGCNLALGGVRDSPDILRKLAIYLEASELI